MATSGRIADGFDIFGSGLAEGEHRRRMVDAGSKRGRTLPHLDAVSVDAPALPARVQAADLGDGLIAHWVADCECGTTSAVWRATPLTFCVRCWNQQYRKRWRPVAFPEDAFIAELERLLAQRPARHRFWSPGESIEAVRDDNAAYGHEV